MGDITALMVVQSQRACIFLLPDMYINGVQHNTLSTLSISTTIQSITHLSVSRVMEQLPFGGSPAKVKLNWRCSSAIM